MASEAAITASPELVRPKHSNRSGPSPWQRVRMSIRILPWNLRLAIGEAQFLALAGPAAVIVGVHLLTLTMAPSSSPISISSDADVQQLSSTANQLWAIEATIFGAMLVALFFAFTSAQRADPSRVVIRRLREEIKLDSFLSLFGGVLFSTGLTVFSLQPGSLRSHASPGTLSALVSIDFVAFALCLVAVMLIVLKASLYTHSSAVEGLARDYGIRLARIVHRYENLESESRSATWTMDLSGRTDDEVYVRRPTAVRKLNRLVADAAQAGVAAIQVDNAPELEKELILFQTLLLNDISQNECERNADAEHQASMSLRSTFRWWLATDWDSPHLHQRIGRALSDLLSAAATQDNSRCTRMLMRFPVNLWARSLDRERHDVARFGLAYSRNAYVALSQTGSNARKAWLDSWINNSPNPENFVMYQARVGSRSTDDERRIFHYMLAAHEVRQHALSIALTAICNGDVDMCTRLVASPANDPDQFWALRSGSASIVSRLAEMDTAEAQAMAMLVGTVAIKLNEGKQLRELLDLLLRASVDYFFDCADKVIALANADLGGGPAWLLDSLNGSEPPYYESDGAPFLPQTEQLQAWTLVLILSRICPDITKLRVAGLESLDAGRAEVRGVIRRIETHGNQWKGFFGRSYLRDLKSLVG